MRLHTWGEEPLPGAEPYVCSRFKVSGELPLMHIKVSDQKIRNILDLVNSIPLPRVGSAPHTPADKVNLRAHRGALQEPHSWPRPWRGCCGTLTTSGFFPSRCSCWLMNDPTNAAFGQSFWVPWKPVCTAPAVTDGSCDF